MGVMFAPTSLRLLEEMKINGHLQYSIGRIRLVFLQH